MLGSLLLGKKKELESKIHGFGVVDHCMKHTLLLEFLK